MLRDEDVTLVFKAVGGDEKEVIDWTYEGEDSENSLGLRNKNLGQF